MCNAHHLRELQREVEEENQRWVRNVSTLLLEINKTVDDAGGQLSIVDSIAYRRKYRDLLEAGFSENRFAGHIGGMIFFWASETPVLRILKRR